MTDEKSPAPNSEQEKREILLSGKDKAWKDFYLKGNFLGAKPIYNELYKTASEWRIDSKTVAEILADKAWNEYFIDKSGITKTQTSYFSAKLGLIALKDAPDLPKIHALRSRLFEVAGLCEAYLVDDGERRESSEKLLKDSVGEAEKSGKPERMGEAKNSFALWLISPKQKRFDEAIPLFQEVAKVQEEIGNKRIAGHAYNNLAVCFNETQKYTDAISSADKALELYEDPNLNHSFSARFRKSIALRGLDKFGEALAIYMLHKSLRVKDLALSENEKVRLIANEDKNIASLRQEMQRLGLT